ncbi:MAG: DNA (cytosine-5-)-methyltransferase [Candidatus Pacebacteria bacterium]|nr:DNA (cytosine-5-)-methyltransferase [Candidatus Paceibacterota bacterium]
MKKQSKDIKVAELFAGVGGFRMGLEGKNKKSGYRVVWSNQWEPSTKRQHASEVYENAFGKDGHSNEDIAKVPVHTIPDHDLLVGGFPCQDYSVARTLSQSAGLQGKKGVLWWSIERILREKKSKAPSFLMLENVDRLVKSPAAQRGRDFAIMLASLSNLGYIVEWRVINAADYGMPQRRRRIYILGYKKGTAPHKEASKYQPDEWLLRNGLFAKSFPVTPKDTSSSNIDLTGELDEISKLFNKESSKGDSPFHNAGLMIGRNVWTIRTTPDYSGSSTLLGDILLPEKDVPEEYFVDEKDLKGWKYLKGGKKEKRKGKDGFEYEYSEGPIAFPDYLDKPSRTIVTGEGGSTPSRFKHIIKLKSGRYRRLTPVELERLNMFPDNHTKLDGISDVKRAFFMGNALVIGVIERLGKELLKHISEM